MPIPDNPQTRQEMYLSAIANGDSGGIPETPYTRKEMYLEAIATGDPSGIPETPYTREEMYLDEIARNGGGGGGGGDITVVSKSISSNGTYTAPTGKAYSPVIVSVPASAVDTGTKSITSNGDNQDVVGYAAVDVAVPNSYAAGDEGKVVSNGELVAQGSDTVTENGPVDTTLINSLTVNVSSSGGDVSALAKRTWPSGEVTLDSDVTEIDEFLFAETPITRIHGQNVTTIKAAAFQKCTELTQITKDDFPSVTTIEADSQTSADATFMGCSKLSLIHFPNLVTIPTNQWPSGTGRIGSSTIKPIIVLPRVTTFPNFRANASSHIAAIDLGPNITTTTISGSAYFYEGYVDILIIRKSDAIVAAGSAGAIRRLSSSTTMYVPQALVSSYQTASNWSTKYAEGMKILAIEGSQYENYYADGTPIQTT